MKALPASVVLRLWVAIALTIFCVVCFDVVTEILQEDIHRSAEIGDDAKLIAQRIDDRVHLDLKRVVKESKLAVVTMPEVLSTAQIPKQLLPWMKQVNNFGLLPLGVEIVFIGNAQYYIHAHENDAMSLREYRLERYLNAVRRDNEEGPRWLAIFSADDNHLDIFVQQRHFSTQGEVFYSIVRVDTPINSERYQMSGQQMILLDRFDTAITIRDGMIKPVVVDYPELSLNSDVDDIAYRYSYQPVETLTVGKERHGNIDYVYFEKDPTPYLMHEFPMRDASLRMLLFMDASSISENVMEEVEEGIATVFMTLAALVIVTLLVYYHLKVRSLIHIDPLTKLYNRGHFLENIDSLLELHDRGRVSDIGVIAIDIDKFKAVNDTYGHAVGDKVLTALAQIMKAETRKSEWLYRFGGEEFIILCSGEPLDSLVGLAERLRTAVEHQNLCLDYLPNGFTISLGVCVRQDDEPIEQVLTRADDLLYKAKGNGRNQVQF